VKEVFKGICLGVDFREGGGGHSVLHEMCNNLNRYEVPYFVGTMHIGDYVFFTQRGTGSDYLLCPILVERKSIEDIALSIHDGRWRNQKQRMYVGQYVFGYENCKIAFIIEGKEEAQQVTHGYIGHRMYGVSIEKVKAEIENLKSEGFEVIMTPSRADTMRELGAWTKRVAEEMRAGIFTAEYTYSQFRNEVKKIPQGTDFSRLAKYAVARKAEPPVAACTLKRVHAEMDSDSDSDSNIEVLQTWTPSTASKKPAARSSSDARSPLTDSKRPAMAASPHQKVTAKNENDSDPYKDSTTEQLKKKCVECGLSKSGTVGKIRARLNGPHPPNVWVRRKQAKQYVPARYNVTATALLVALYLHEKNADKDDPGMTKEELYIKAEELVISKNPFSGGTTQTGPYLYDGWSSMAPLLKGDPALVILYRRRYKLTRSSELAGYTFAEAMHKWCHQHNSCPCGATDF
jgi:ERCC4-type nuclease